MRTRLRAGPREALEAAENRAEKCNGEAKGGEDVAGRDNLKSLDQRPPDEARAIRSSGGRASAASRRRKRAFREYASLILNLRPRAQAKLRREWEALGYDVEAEGLPTVAERLAMQLARRAEDGDDAALRLLMSYSHNPTMTEKIEADRAKALAEGKGAKVELNVRPEQAGVMDEIRAMMEREEAPTAAMPDPQTQGEAAGEGATP